MARFSLKSYLPRGLYGRAALILIVPIVTIQLVTSVTFIQRHFEGVTEQMTRGIAIEMRYLLAQVSGADTIARAEAEARRVGQALDLDVRWPGVEQPTDQRRFYDLSGRAVVSTLRGAVPGVRGVDLAGNAREVRVSVATAWGPLEVTIDRRRVSASNPHQLLVLLIFTSALMTLIAFLFLSNQLRPIKKLGDAAAAFGRGRTVVYRPRGALEVRAAGNAFLDMRARIERQIESRTLMLSGISHDLRTPLTRLKLGLSLLPQDEDTEALTRDVADMERLVDEFLAFARGDAMEEASEVDPADLVARLVENARRMGQAVSLARVDGSGAVRLRPTAVARALENLIGNAVRHGTRTEVSVALTDRVVRLTVEDDGPGIPRERREEAVTPFARLDGARDPNRGGGVGLGLSIAADIARSHGGVLRLGSSESLGGLKAELVLAR